MVLVPLPSAIYIDTTQQLIELAESLLCAAPLIAVDTESNSLHAYRERVCLIQISTRGQDFIVDPLALPDLTPLNPVMCAPEVQKIFHAADYDITCLKRDFGFEFNNIFDTMLAARLCGLQAVGLASILYEYAGVQMDKSHQLDNWGLRPLSEDSLQYAQMDTHFLPYLRDELMQQLHELDRIEEAQELFDEFTMLPATTIKDFNPEGYWQIGRPNHLKRHEMIVLRELYLWRERTAMDNDLPAFKVMSNNVLATLSRRKPRTTASLTSIHGISKRFVNEHGDEILEAIKNGRSRTDLPPPPHSRQLDHGVLERYSALHLWRKDKAQSRGVDSDVILSKHILWQLAHQFPDTLDKLGEVDGIGPWRLENYGSELLGVLNHEREF